jgi:hypothetical protein
LALLLIFVLWIHYNRAICTDSCEGLDSRFNIDGCQCRTTGPWVPLRG